MAVLSAESVGLDEIQWISHLHRLKPKVVQPFQKSEGENWSIILYQLFIIILYFGTILDFTNMSLPFTNWRVFNMFCLL